jgi:predicted dehydrogenase
VLAHLLVPDVAPRCTVTALCDAARGRAEAAALAHGVPHHFDSLDEMVASGLVDAVTVATPIGLHYEHVRTCLAAGLHVHVNKTIATSVDEATDLIERARAHGLVLLPSPGEVIRPQVHRLRELLADGEIGTPAFAVCGSSHGRYHETEAERAAGPEGEVIDPSWYFLRPGGGPMWDVTVYALHNLTAVLGPARRVTALSGCRIPIRHFAGRELVAEADDSTLLLLDFGDSLFAFAHGTAAGTLTRDFGTATYFGTAGIIDGYRMNGELIDFPGSELVGQSPGWDEHQRVLPHVTEPHWALAEQHVFEDVMQMVDAVLEGREVPIFAEHARHVVDIIESGYEAARTGVTQLLRTTFELR